MAGFITGAQQTTLRVVMTPAQHKHSGELQWRTAGAPRQQIPAGLLCSTVLTSAYTMLSLYGTSAQGGVIFGGMFIRVPLCTMVVASQNEGPTAPHNSFQACLSAFGHLTAACWLKLRALFQPGCTCLAPVTCCGTPSRLVPPRAC